MTTSDHYPDISQLHVREEADPFTADAPVRDPTHDQFRRWPFAQRVAQTIASRHDPSSIVIGIYGAWGEGKTTVLNFINEELKHYSHVICLRFNPWRFVDEEKLLAFFFAELAGALGKSLSTKLERLGEVFGKYAVAPASLLGQGEAAKAFGELLSSVELEKLRKRIEDLLKEEGKRVVVLMDDIDRLDKSEIQAVFRLIKLSVDFDYTAYVLAFDDDMVAAALQETYSAKSADAGRNFLEKIVQVPLRLPAIPSPSLTSYCFKSVEQALHEAQIQLSEQEVRAFARHFIDGLEIRLRTPRMAKRYGNTLAFGLPIMKGEVNAVDFMLIEGIRVFYPELHDIIKKYPDVFLGQSLTGTLADEQQRKETAEVIERGLSNFRSEEKAAANNLLVALFPRLKSVLGNIMYGSEWDIRWANEQRVASSAYFPRYFSYSIPEGDIADRDVAALIEEAEAGELGLIAQKLKGLITAQNADRVVAKLRAKASTVSVASSRKLATVVAMNGVIFPNNRSAFSFQGAFSQAAMLTCDLVDNIVDGVEKLTFARRVLQEAEPITFGVEIHRWQRARPENDPKALSNEQQAELGRIVAERIEQLAVENASFITQFSEDIPFLMSVWSIWGSPTDTSDYIQKKLETDKTLAVTFLKCYVPTQWGMEDGLPSKGDFERNQYDSVAQVVNPNFIFDALQATYGARLDVKDFPIGDGTLLDERVAQQFAWLHKHVKQKAKEEHAVADGINTEPE